MLTDKVSALGGTAVVAKHWAEGGKGAEDLAKAVVEVIAGSTKTHEYLYQDTDTLWDKMRSIATRIYGAADITASPKIITQIESLQEQYGHFPVCMAKTQMSFSTDPSKIGAPSGHTVEISEVRLSAGAGFIVAIAGNMMTMPGLPKKPAAESIDVGANGEIIGLF